LPSATLLWPPQTSQWPRFSRFSTGLPWQCFISTSKKVPSCSIHVLPNSSLTFNFQLWLNLDFLYLNLYVPGFYGPPPPPNLLTFIRTFSFPWICLCLLYSSLITSSKEA
jgi:hypothetical protein